MIAAETARRPVLVVDDDRDIRETLSDILEQEGYPVRTAANGREALASLRAGERPGLILLDLSMPIMSGTEFRRVQLGDASLACIPTAVISAAGSLAQMLEGLGIDLVMAKPLELERLLALVARFCA